MVKKVENKNIVKKDYSLFSPKSQIILAEMEEDMRIFKEKHEQWRIEMGLVKMK